VKDVEMHGYYGGVRLLKATVRLFYDYCRADEIELNDKNFTIRYKSNIPHGVGLAGSSAIITSCLRALMTFYGISIPKPTQASLVLSAESDELHIPAGLQDRVIQVYEGLVYMDFNKSTMEKRGHGKYEEMDPRLLPPLYVAYRSDLSEGTEVFHNNIRERFDRGDETVLRAMRFWTSLTDKVKSCLFKGDVGKIGELLNANFDRRSRIYRIGAGNIQMVEEARSVGASAKFTGSGGAIVGLYKDEEMFKVLKKRLGRRNIKIIKPRIAVGSQRIRV
jgi:glucuronokinase